MLYKAVLLLLDCHARAWPEHPGQPLRRLPLDPRLKAEGDDVGRRDSFMR